MKIIAFEGGDRTGKATQSNMLVHYLRGQRKRVHLVEVPIKGNIEYKLIYWMLQNGTAKKFPKIFQWLQHRNRKKFQDQFLNWLSKVYDFVIFDRWSLSSVVYGAAMGVSPEFTLPLHKSLISPDATLVLDGPTRIYAAEDEYERDSELQASVKLLYKAWALNEERTVIIDAVGSPAEVHGRVLDYLRDKEII